MKNHVAVYEAYAAAPDGRLFAFGGETGPLGGETRYGWAEFFDVPIPGEPEGRWTEVTPMPAGYERSHAAAYDGNGGILLMGGLDQVGNRMASVLRYDLAGDAWTHVADLPRPMSDRSAALGPDGGVYAVGGGAYISSQVTSFVDIYDPITNTWSAGPDLLTARGLSAVAVSDDGYLYVMGGSTPGVGTDAVERLLVPEPGGLTFLLLVGTSPLWRRRTRPGRC